VGHLIFVRLSTLHDFKANPKVTYSLINICWINILVRLNKSLEWTDVILVRLRYYLCDIFKKTNNCFI